MTERNPFNPKIVYGLIVLGIAAFAGIIWVMAYGGPARQQQTELSRAQMMSPAAVGFRGLVQLVGQVRQTYTISTSSDLDYDDLLVLAIDENTRSEDVSWVRQRRAARPTLIILPKWRTVANLRRGDWVTAVGPGAGHRVAAQLGYRLALRDRAAPGTQLAGESFLAGVGVPAPGAAAGDRGRRPRSPALFAQWRHHPRPDQGPPALPPRRPRSAQQSRHPRSGTRAGRARARWTG